MGPTPPSPHRSMRAALLPLLVSVLLVPRLAVNAQSESKTVPQTEEERVLETEDEYVEAEVNRDEATLRRLVDDRFVFNRSNGTTTGKEELIQGVLKMNMVDQTITERSVIVEGDIALIFGTAELRFARTGDEESISNLRYTSAYVKRQGLWRMLALQMQRRASE